MQNPKADLQQYDRYIRRKQAALALALLVTLTAALLYMGIGSIRLSPAEILRVFFGGGEAKHVTAIRNIRLPRVLAAMLIGAVLASSGAVMQCVLRNPLASASTLGVSQGAAFGAALGMTAVFCGVTNCPMTSLFLAYELFGGRGLGMYAVVCAVSYLVSGYGGLYSAQEIVYSKIRPERYARMRK